MAVFGQPELTSPRGVGIRGGWDWRWFSPRRPTETLQQIIARDEAPVSANTVLRELNDPAARLFQAVQRTPTASKSQPSR